MKVGDFGLARVVDGLYYKQKRSICLPFMWMSIESLVDRKFSTSSDVVSLVHWSYSWSCGLLSCLWSAFCVFDA